MNPSLEQIYSTLYTILARFIKNIFFVLTFFFVVVYEVDFILKKAKRITKKIMMLLQMSQGRVEELIGLIDFS
jgi:reverse gyrase